MMMTGWWLRRRRNEIKEDEAGRLDCAAIMERLYEYIDEELDDPRLVSAIRDHLEKCKVCFPQYEFEKAFLRFLAQRGANGAPPRLRRRIFQHLLEEESQS